jgi:hypothetical protein
VEVAKLKEQTGKVCPSHSFMSQSWSPILLLPLGFVCDLSIYTHIATLDGWQAVIFWRTALYKISSVIYSLVEINRVLSGAVMAVKTRRQGAFTIGRVEKTKGVKGQCSELHCLTQPMLYVPAMKIMRTIERRDGDYGNFSERWGETRTDGWARRASTL